MKIFHKILVAFSLVITGFLVTSFYYNIPDRHAATVSPQKMNVFYIGVDNPVEITACGIDPSDLRPSIVGGTLIANGGRGRYLVRVSGGTESTVNVMWGDSVKVNLGSFKFRLKRVPDPVAYLGNLKADGFMTKVELQGVSGIFARMENFDFDLKFRVVSFEMSLLVDGKWNVLQANGPSLTQEMKSALAKVLVGDKVLFHKVIVKGPDGTIRKIPGVMIDVK